MAVTHGMYIAILFSIQELSGHKADQQVAMSEKETMAHKHQYVTKVASV